MNLEDGLDHVHGHPWLRLGLHVLFWLLFYAVHCYIEAITFDAFRGTPATYLSPLRVTLSVLVVYYPLVYYVLPVFLMRKKYLAAILAVCLLIGCYTVLDYWLERLLFALCVQCRFILKTSLPEYDHFLQGGFLRVVLARILTLAILYQLGLALAVPLGLKLGVSYLSQRFRSLKLAQENSRLEFDFLKSQVNPHFLFNTLNNIYGLILQQHTQQAAETVARLAGFMRYTLYESSQEKNSLQREIQLLHDYIALAKLRFNATRVECRVEVDAHPYHIEPLLFMPVVENAFKYCSTDAEADSWIQIHLKARQGNLQLVTANTYLPVQRPATSGGIGLQNLQKRLNNAYPAQHHVQIEDAPPVYKVTIELRHL